MKTTLTKSQKTISTVILIIAVVFLYNFYQSENKPTVKEAKQVVVAPFFTMQQNETGFYTPENYLLDFYKNINSKDWNYILKHSLKQYNLDRLKADFSSKNFLGIKILSTEKRGKEMAFIAADITYVNTANDTISKRVNAQLQLATDYKTWIVAPLTVF